MIRRALPADACPRPSSPPHRDSLKFHGGISRGSRAFRFCWAGYNYLPVRGFSRAAIVERARDVRRHTNKIGLVSTAVCDHPEIEAIVDDLAGLDYEVSVASLRLDDLTPEFVFKLADTGVHGLTLAPECGTDRMRRILNKQFNNARSSTVPLDLRERDPTLSSTCGPALGVGHGDGRDPVTPTSRSATADPVSARGRGDHPPPEPLRAQPGPHQWCPEDRRRRRKLQFYAGVGRMANLDAVIKSARTGFSQSSSPSPTWGADALEYAAIQRDLNAE